MLCKSIRRSSSTSWMFEFQSLQTKWNVTDVSLTSSSYFVQRYSHLASRKKKNTKNGSSLRNRKPSSAFQFNVIESGHKTWDLTHDPEGAIGMIVLCSNEQLSLVASVSLRSREEEKKSRRANPILCRARARWRDTWRQEARLHVFCFRGFRHWFAHACSQRVLSVPFAKFWGIHQKYISKSIERGREPSYIAQCALLGACAKTNACSVLFLLLCWGHATWFWMILTTSMGDETKVGGQGSGRDLAKKKSDTWRTNFKSIISV